MPIIYPNTEPRVSILNFLNVEIYLINPEYDAIHTSESKLIINSSTSRYVFHYKHGHITIIYSYKSTVNIW